MLTLTVVTPREELKQLLKTKFPHMWLKDSEEFDGTKGLIWTGEGSHIGDEFETPMFNYYDRREVIYSMGVHKKLNEFVNKHGWYCEFYDPGTVFISQD